MVAVLIIKYYFAHGEVIFRSGSILLLSLFVGKTCSCLFSSLWTLGEAEESRQTVRGGLVSGCYTLQKHLVLVSMDPAPVAQDTEILC